MALKCQDKDGDGGAGSMCVYLQTGMGSGSDDECKKKKQKHIGRHKRPTHNESSSGVCVFASGQMLAGQVVVTSLTFQAYK